MLWHAPDFRAVLPRTHLWSLAVEEQFSLVWPLLLLAVWAGRRGARSR
jgi:peptidoglycan/LPS O-acetylase OafA/YrhL